MGSQRALDDREAVAAARREAAEEGGGHLHEALVIDHPLAAQLGDHVSRRPIDRDLYPEADVLGRGGRCRAELVLRIQTRD